MQHNSNGSQQNSSLSKTNLNIELLNFFDFLLEKATQCSRIYTDL